MYLKDWILIKKKTKTTITPNSDENFFIEFRFKGRKTKQLIILNKCKKTHINY